MSETAGKTAETMADGTQISDHAPKALEGGCECGGTRWQIAKGSPMGPVAACHCGQCNRITSHVLTAVSIPDEHLSWPKTDTLNWYASSSFGERGFCGRCGTQLMWRLSDASERKTSSLMAGSFDDKNMLKLSHHIFVAHKASYYEITDGLPQYPEGD